MNRMVLIVFAVLLLLFLLGGGLSGLYTDWLWFGQVQYSAVFLTGELADMYASVLQGQAMTHQDRARPGDSR